MQNKIDYLMHNQKFLLLKSEVAKEEASAALHDLGVRKNSEFYDFYMKYFGRALISKKSYLEMIDPCPSNDMQLTTEMAHSVWNIPESYILFTTGEGEGGYLYNKDNETVWDFTLGEQEFLGTDKMRHWNSFYEFLEWYLTPDE